MTQAESTQGQIEAQLMRSGCTIAIAIEAAKDLASGLTGATSKNIAEAYQQIMAARMKVGDRCSFSGIGGQVATGTVIDVVRSGGEDGFNIYTVQVDKECYCRVYHAEVTLTQWNVRFVAESAAIA